eukprot:1000740-Rhodomonas_salina.1
MASRSLSLSALSLALAVSVCLVVDVAAFVNSPASLSWSSGGKLKFGARCVIERRPKSFSDSAIGLRASSENKDGKEDFAAMAARAQAEAEKAAQRAAAVR